MFQLIIDRILQVNFIGWVITFITTKIGFLSLTKAPYVYSCEHITKIAMAISAVTGAIYGVYKIIDLAYKGLLIINNKIKKYKHDR